MKTDLTIRNCDTYFRFVCPKQWDELTPSSSDNVRQCETCDRDVFFCRSDEETIQHARAGHCIAREVPNGCELPVTMLGEPEEEPRVTSEQEDAERWAFRERGIIDSIKNISEERACPQCGYPHPAWRKACRVCGLGFGNRADA